MRDLEHAKSQLDQQGYCIVEGVIGRDAAASLRDRLNEQVAAEEQLEHRRVGPDKKQYVSFLLNKGQGFRDLLFVAEMRALVEHILGPHYLLSSYSGHLALPGGSRVFHRDQWWMPAPIIRGQNTSLRAGAITRLEDRGHRRSGEAGTDPVAISPACSCNVMWTIDDFTAANGATIVVPGSHLYGREPDPDLDQDAGWIPGEAPAGSIIVLDGRVWHSTGENRTEQPRIGLTTNFCAWQFRQQENLVLGVSDEVLATASTELLDLIGFQPGSGSGSGYGGLEGRERLRRGEYALGELKPESADPRDPRHGG